MVEVPGTATRVRWNRTIGFSRLSFEFALLAGTPRSGANPAQQPREISHAVGGAVPHASRTC